MVSLQPAFLASSATASTKHVLFLTLQIIPGRVAQEGARPEARGAISVRRTPRDPRLTGTHIPPGVARCWAS